MEPATGDGAPADGGAAPGTPSRRDPALRLSASVSRVASRPDDDGDGSTGDDGDRSGNDDSVLPGESEPPPRKALNWRRTLYALWFAQILALIAFSMRAPFLPYYLADLGLDNQNAQIWWSTVIGAAGALCMAISAPIWGIVSDRFGRKPMVIRAMLFAAFTIGLMALATSPWHLFGLRLIEGAFTGTVTACAALVAATVPRDRVGFGLGLIQTSVFSGGSLGPLFGGFLAEQIGYRWTCAVGAMFMVVGLLIVVFLVEERFQPVRRRAVEGERTGWRGGMGRQFAILSVPIVAMMVIATLVIRGTSMAVQPILPIYVADLPSLRISNDEMAGLVLGAQGLTSAIAAVFLGRLGDRIGHRGILSVCAVGAGLLYLPMAFVHQSWQLLILQALFGVTAGGLVPAANALVAHATRPEQRGVVFGLMAGAGSLGAFVGPLAVAGLATSGSFALAFLAIGASLLLMAAAVIYVFRHAARETPPTAAAA